MAYPPIAPRWGCLRPWFIISSWVSPGDQTFVRILPWPSPLGYPCRRLISVLGALWLPWRVLVRRACCRGALRFAWAPISLWLLGRAFLPPRLRLAPVWSVECCLGRWPAPFPTPLCVVSFTRCQELLPLRRPLQLTFVFCLLCTVQCFMHIELVVVVCSSPALVGRNGFHVACVRRLLGHPL